MDVLEHAYACCRANKGAPGIDGLTFEGVEAYGRERWIGELAQQLKKETYRPEAVRRVYIPKPNGKLRPLGIPRQRCAVHFYRNVWTAVPSGKVKGVAAMLKAIHAQEDAQAAREKARQVVMKLREMRLARAAEIVEASIDETLTYYAKPAEHWRCLRTNNPLERLMREIRRRTRVVGAFPDGKSALMLVAARLRHVAATKWGTKRYLQMNRLAEVRAIA